MEFTNRTCMACKLPHYRCKKTMACRKISGQKNAIDPIDRLIASINEREERKKKETILKTFFFHANVLIKGLDNFSSHFLYNFN